MKNFMKGVAVAALMAMPVSAFAEAESYPGPSLVIAYSHCIAHGYDLAMGCDQQKLAVDSGHWPLYRFDPRRRTAGENPFQLDSAAPKVPLSDYVYNETRYRMLQKMDPERAKHLLRDAQDAVQSHYALYEQLSHLKVAQPETPKT